MYKKDATIKSIKKGCGASEGDRSPECFDSFGPCEKNNIVGGQNMLRYAVRRLITSVLTLFLMITLTFFLMQLVPGGPFLGENVKKDVVERLLAKYGFDRPILIQYGDYLKNLLKGDLGVSTRV